MTKRPDLAARNRGNGGPYEDAEWCRTRYKADATYRELAIEAGCSLRTIARWMHVHGIEIPKAAHKRQQRGTFPTVNTVPLTCSCGRPKARSAATCMKCHDRTGERGSRWLGPNAGNRAVHQRVMALHGKATEHDCQHCGTTAAHWAYDHSDPNEKPSADGPYSTDVERYFPLCVKCHKQFDMNYIRYMRSSA